MTYIIILMGFQTISSINYRYGLLQLIVFLYYTSMKGAADSIIHALKLAKCLGVFEMFFISSCIYLIFPLGSTGSLQQQ